MVQVIVERSFKGPADIAELQAKEDDGVRCLQEHRVRYVRTWFSRDQRRMICVYEAPDAESVRIAQRKAGMSFDRAWSATLNPAPADYQGSPPHPLEHVVVERTFEEPATSETVAAMYSRGRECLSRHRLAYLGGHIASDGRRMVCVFAAPDAESVRIANREADAPFDRAWTATLHEAAAPA